MRVRERGQARRTVGSMSGAELERTGQLLKGRSVGGDVGLLIQAREGWSERGRGSRASANAGRADSMEILRARGAVSPDPSPRALSLSLGGRRSSLHEGSVWDRSEGLRRPLPRPCLVLRHGPDPGGVGKERGPPRPSVFSEPPCFPTSSRRER